MDKVDFINYWVESSKHDLRVAQSLLNARHFDYCLYLCHLSIEKILKALWVKHNIENNPPMTHNLVYLAQHAGLDLNDEQLKFLQFVNSFNLGIRYPDYKFKIYHLCDEEFTQRNFSRVEELQEWLMKKL